VRRAAFPPEYGTRGGSDDEPLDWEGVAARLRDAPNYWVVTVAPDGRPHARPVDGVWVDGCLAFGGSPGARWVRNLQADLAASAHLPSGDDPVIVEGIAEYVDDPGHPLADRVASANRAKYPQYVDPRVPHAFQPFWMLRARVVYAWSLAGFPKRATRWTFGD
jgi:hypothetical protein